MWHCNVSIALHKEKWKFLDTLVVSAHHNGTLQFAESTNINEIKSES